MLWRRDCDSNASLLHTRWKTSVTVTKEMLRSHNITRSSGYEVRQMLCSNTNMRHVRRTFHIMLDTTMANTEHRASIVLCVSEIVFLCFVVLVHFVLSSNENEWFFFGYNGLTATPKSRWLWQCPLHALRNFPLLHFNKKRAWITKAELPLWTQSIVLIVQRFLFAENCLGMWMLSIFSRMLSQFTFYDAQFALLADNLIPKHNFLLCLRRLQSVRLAGFTSVSLNI